MYSSAVRFSTQSPLLKVSKIENQAEDMYDSGIERLFAMENNTKLLIKKRDIYHTLNKATDKCEDAVNAIETVIIKHT